MKEVYVLTNHFHAIRAKINQKKILSFHSEENTLKHILVVEYMLLIT